MLGGGILQGGERDLEPELLKLGDEAAGLSFRIMAPLEVPVAEVVVDLAGAEHVPDQVAQAVGDGDGDGDGGLVGASAFGDLAVLRPEVASFGAGSGAGGLDQGPPEPGLPGVTPTRRRLPADS